MAAEAHSGNVGSEGGATESIYAQDRPNFSQGQSHDFGGPSDDAYGSKGLEGGGGGLSSVSSDSSNRMVSVTLGGKTIHLSVHQPIYRNMQDKPAIFFKIMNGVVGVLLLASCLYRFFASFSGHIVEVRCKDAVITLAVNGTQLKDIDCTLLLPYVSASPDGFELWVQSCFLIAFTSINVLEEFDYKRVAAILDPYLSFMSNLMFRGLYLLFISSLIMTASHSFLLFSGALAMTVAFLYMLLYGLSHYTSHGRTLGVQNYNTQVPDDFEAPLPNNLQQGGQSVAT